MAELKSLNDFYDPTRTMQVGLQYMQGQQHLALQNQQVQQQKQNLEVDNLQKALSAADPMQSYPIQKQINDRLGLPTPPVNEYYANLPYAKRREGARQLGAAAGLPNVDENVSTLIEHSSAMQKELTDKVAMSAMDQTKLRQYEVDQAEHNGLVTNVNTRLNSLVPLASSAKLAIERSAPHVADLDVIEQQYLKDQKNLGIKGAADKRRESILLNPELQQFTDRRMQALPQIQQQVQQLEEAQAKLEARATLVAQGAAPLGEGESVHKLAGEVDALSQQLAYEKAKLAFTKTPSPANHQALQTLHAGMEAQIESLNQQKNASRASIDIHRDAQQETARQNLLTRERTDNIGKAQVAWMESGGDMKQAAKFAKQFGVKVDEVTKAAELPNKPLVQINQSQEKAEAAKVGGGFGEQYLDLQKGAIESGHKLTRLNRMEQLLEGVQTGKLTPTVTQLQAVAESFGIQLDKTLPAKQAVESLSNELALSLRNPSGGAGMPGAMSDKDREFLVAMPAGLAKTPEGNRLIIETSRAVEQRNQQVAKMARAYRTKHGHFDEGFLDELQAYSDAHPLFKDKKYPQAGGSKPLMTEKELVAPFHDPEEERLYQKFKREHK